MIGRRDSFDDEAWRQFAAAALQGIAASTVPRIIESDVADAAKFADLMLAEYQRREQDS